MSWRLFSQIAFDTLWGWIYNKIVVRGTEFIRGGEMPARFNFSSEESHKKAHYQKLLGELKALIEQTEAEDLDLSERGHLLTCSECGAYEDVTPAEDFVVYDTNDTLLSYKEFIIIDGKQRIFEKKKPFQAVTTYTFICPSCGAYQSAIIREKYEEDIGAQQE